MPFLVSATSALSPVPLEHRSWAQLCTDMAWLVPWSHLTDRTVEAQGCKCIIAGLPIASILWQSLLSGHSNILHVVWSCWCLGPCPGCLSWLPVLAACPGSPGTHTFLSQQDYSLVLFLKILSVIFPHIPPSSQASLGEHSLVPSGTELNL